MICYIMFCCYFTWKNCYPSEFGLLALGVVIAAPTATCLRDFFQADFCVIMESQKLSC